MNNLILLLILTIGMAPARLASQSSQPEDLRITGMYSSLAYNEEGGDLLGMEVYLIYGGGDTYFALVQCAEGGPGTPHLTPVKLSGRNVTFNLSASSPECGISFAGVLSKDGLKGRFAGQEEDLWLPRKKGYWE